MLTENHRMVAESSGNTKQLQVLLHTCDLHYLKQLFSGSPPCSDHFPIFSYCKWGISIKTWWLWWDLPVQRPFAPPPSPYRGVPGSTCSAAHHPFPPDSKTMGTGDIMRYAVIKFPLRNGGEESPNCHFICLRV